MAATAVLIRIGGMGIGSDTTMMTDITDATEAIATLANLMYTATSARETTHAKTVSANRIVATEEAVEVGGLLRRARSRRTGARLCLFRVRAGATIRGQATQQR